MSHTFDYSSQVYFNELDGLGLLHHTRYLLHRKRFSLERESINRHTNQP